MLLKLGELVKTQNRAEVASHPDAKPLSQTHNASVASACATPPTPGTVIAVAIPSRISPALQLLSSTPTAQHTYDLSTWTKSSRSLPTTAAASSSARRVRCA